MLWEVSQPFYRTPNLKVGFCGKNKFCESKCKIWLSDWAEPLGWVMLTALMHE